MAIKVGSAWAVCLASSITSAGTRPQQLLDHPDAVHRAIPKKLQG